MKLYRLLTGADDAAFCERVERLLNLGWTLYGSSAVTFDGSKTVAAQAIVKDVDGDYTGFVHLDDLYPRD